jgi:hypothetical protein
MFVGMYPETNTLPKQPYPAALRRGWLIGLRDYKSLTVAIKEYIRYKFQRLYFDNTNRIGRFSHSVLSNFGLVKSTEQIEDEVVDGFYHLVKNYFIKNIICKVTAFTVFYAIFFLLLKPIVFAHTLHMNVIQVIFYPFTVALPKVIGILKA